MTPQQAQAEYVRADDRFLEHARTCRDCIVKRVRYPRYCPVAKQLSEIAFSRRQDWGAAVAAERASTATIPDRQDWTDGD